MNKEANQLQQTLMIMYYNSFVCVSILQKICAAPKNLNALLYSPFLNIHGEFWCMVTFGKVF